MLVPGGKYQGYAGILSTAGGWLAEKLWLRTPTRGMLNLSVKMLGWMAMTSAGLPLS